MLGKDISETQRDIEFLIEAAFHHSIVNSFQVTRHLIIVFRHKQNTVFMFWRNQTQATIAKSQAFLPDRYDRSLALGVLIGFKLINNKRDHWRNDLSSNLKSDDKCLIEPRKEKRFRERLNLQQDVI